MLVKAKPRLAFCPNCGALSLKETVLRDGTKLHECLNVCAYYQVWKPTGDSYTNLLTPPNGPRGHL